jgi:hypothetical protein
MLAVMLCYMATRSIEQRGSAQGDDLVRSAYIVASTWERAYSDGVRLIALPVLDRVLLLASTGALDVDARDLDEINRSRFRAGEPFRTMSGGRDGHNQP